MAVAVNCCVMPMARVKSSGVTEIEEILGAVTVTVVDCMMLPRFAVTVAAPAPTPVTRPVALTVATEALEDGAQVTSRGRSRVLPSLYVPVAVSCCEVLTGMEGLAGVRAMETRLVPALPTVTILEPPNDPERAEMLTTPVATPVATPAAVTEATLGSEELHWTVEVRSCVEPSENVPVAWRDAVAETAIDVLPGVTETAVRDADPGCVPPPVG